MFFLSLEKNHIIYFLILRNTEIIYMAEIVGILLKMAY